MKTELTKRQWALYNYLKDKGDVWTPQAEIAETLCKQSVGEYYGEYVEGEDFHNQPARMRMTLDIRAINDSSVIQKIIISSPRGIKIANSEEFERYISKEKASVLRRLIRVNRKIAKGAKDKQMRLVFGSERDTIKAFLDSDREFGLRLKQAREAKGLSQKDVVSVMRELGYKSFDNPTLSRFENGLCLPNGRTLKLFAEIYDISVESLFTGEFATDKETNEKGDLQVVIGGGNG